ncbi:MAG: DUF2334 domain-containing protein [Elusimicrobiota bacterium]
MKKKYKENKKDIRKTIRFLCNLSDFSFENKGHLRDWNLNVSANVFLKKAVAKVKKVRPDLCTPSIEKVVKLKKECKVDTDANAGRLKFLIRVDDFPRWDINWNKYKKFHRIFKAKDVPYLLGVTPLKCSEPKNPDKEDFSPISEEEGNYLKSIYKNNTEIALHGFTHKVLDENVKSELVGLDNSELKRKTERALEILDRFKIYPKVFIPPYNSISPREYNYLGKYFDIICGGPESISWMGYKISPSVLNGSMYLPSYPPLYGRAEEILNYITELDNKTFDVSLTLPVTLHWAWEKENDFEMVDALVDKIQDRIISWNKFIRRI